MELIWNKDRAVIPGGAGELDLKRTLDCGQAFRWRMRPDGDWEGAASGRYLVLGQRGEDIVLFPASQGDLSFWRSYLDLDRDYGALFTLFSRNPTMRRALAECPGIRILRQDPWETLCTFILSANNNVPRIKGIVERLCDGFGDPIPGTGMHSFPSPGTLAPLSQEDLAPLRAGWRGAYLLDAAQKVASGQLDLSALGELPTDLARERLMTVNGVGVKVAQCILLFGYARVECVPMDVWMKRVMASLYPKGFPRYLLPQAGIAQQVLFHCARCSPGALGLPQTSTKKTRSA